MSSEWKSTTLGQICAAQGGAIQTGPFGSQLHTSDYKEFGVPVVMPTNIGDGGIVLAGIARIDQSDVERLSQHKLKLGDIVFSRRGDVTKNALVREHEIGWFCGTGCLKVRLGEESIANAKFISHCLRLPDIKDWLIRHAVGATMPNLNTGILSAVPIDLPPLQTQLEIAAMLGALDDRITLLREINATLEAIAQALFKSWFVDFDPVRAKMEGRAPEGMDEATAALFPDALEESELGWVPQGWRVAALSHLSKISSGARPNVRSDVITDAAAVPLFGGAGVMGFTDESLYQSRKILTGRVGTLGKVHISYPPFWASDNVLVLSPEDECNFIFCFHWLKSIDVHALNRGSTQPLLTQKDLGKQQHLIPDKSIMRTFSDTTESLYQAIRQNAIQAQTIATLRDTLLPRLISGQLRLPEAMAETEEAAA